MFGYMPSLGVKRFRNPVAVFIEIVRNIMQVPENGEYYVNDNKHKA